MEYPVQWTEPVVEAVDNGHEMIELPFEFENAGPLTSGDESSQQFYVLNLTRKLLV